MTSAPCYLQFTGAVADAESADHRRLQLLPDYGRLGGDSQLSRPQDLVLALDDLVGPKGVEVDSHASPGHLRHHVGPRAVPLPRRFARDGVPVVGAGVGRKLQENEGGRCQMQLDIITWLLPDT